VVSRRFIWFQTLQSGVWSQLRLIRHPGLKAQVYVECDKTKLEGVLFKQEPNVPSLVVWAKEGKVLTSNDAVKRAVKKEMLLIFKRLHRTVTTNMLFSM